MKPFIWLAWSSGYLLAAWQYHRLADWFAPHLKSPWVGEIAGFLIIFFAVLIVAGFAGQVRPLVDEESRAQRIDRFLGAVLGLLEGVLVVAIVLTAMTAFRARGKWLADSELAPYFLVGGRAAIWLAPSELRQRFYQGLDYMRHVPRRRTKCGRQRAHRQNRWASLSQRCSLQQNF